MKNYLNLISLLLTHYYCYASQEKIEEAKATPSLRKNGLQSLPYPVMPYPIYISPTVEPTATPNSRQIFQQVRVIDTFENETGFPPPTHSPSMK